MCLNEFNNEVYTCCSTSIEFRLIFSLIIIITIPFSIYGWLCTLQVIPNNMGFCNESFTIAVCTELMLLVFFIAPIIVGTILNCICPLKSQDVYEDVHSIQNSARVSSSQKQLQIKIHNSPRISGSSKVIPIEIKIPNSPKMSIPNHAYNSFNQLYKIQEKRKSKSPTRRLSV